MGATSSTGSVGTITEAQQAAGGSKLHYNHTFSPFGDDE